jgi:hypothetical protein
MTFDVGDTVQFDRGVIVTGTVTSVQARGPERFIDHSGRVVT